MGRLTEMIVYLNSTTKDWQTSNGLHYSQFTKYNITDKAKDIRKWYQYGKEDTYQEYLKNKNERRDKKIGLDKP